MKSIKPGRGPSKMNAWMSVAVGLFGVIWTVAALRMGAPSFMALFGLVFIAIAVGQAVYHFRNAEQPERYSLLDIVDSSEEPDPLNRALSAAAAPPEETEERAESGAAGFCPYCGAPTGADHVFCKRCGKRLT